MGRFSVSYGFLGIICMKAMNETVPPPPPLVEVVVDKVVLDPYQPKSSFVGRLQAIEDVSIQAQITGYLVARRFTEGEMVEAGDILYEIDPAGYGRRSSASPALVRETSR